jgi:hypothetical protein
MKMSEFQDQDVAPVGIIEGERIMQIQEGERCLSLTGIYSAA